MGFLNRCLQFRLAGHLDCDRWALEEKRKYLRFFPKDVATVLDVGCGRGELLWLLRNDGFEVAGCDIDRICISKARSITEEVKYADIGTLSRFYSDNSFDLVTCLHVLEHCPCPFTALGEVRTVTKRYVLIAVPNARYIVHDERDTHLYSWNKKTLEKLLGKVGFKTLALSEDYVNIFPNVLRIAPVLSKVLLRIFWGPMELIALVQR